MACLLRRPLEMADGSSATKAAGVLDVGGELLLEVDERAELPPVGRGAGLKVLGRSPVAGRGTTVTLGTWGLAASTVPPKLSNREKPPTMAKSFSTSSWVSCLLGAPE